MVCRAAEPRVLGRAFVKVGGEAGALGSRPGGFEAAIRLKGGRVREECSFSTTRLALKVGKLFLPKRVLGGGKEFFLNNWLASRVQNFALAFAGVRCERCPLPLWSGTTVEQLTALARTAH